MSRYRRFTFFFFAATFTPMLIVGLFNAAIDPYGVFASPVFAGINKAKPEKFNQDLLFKAAEVIRLKPTTIFLGSSKEQWSLDPNHPAIEKSQAYNLGLQAANMYTVRRYFEHALANQPQIKRVILGIDFSMFNENIDVTSAFQENRLEKGYLRPQEVVNLTLSLDTLDTSKETLALNRKQAEKDSIFVSRFNLKGNVYEQGKLVFAEDETLPGSLPKFVRGMARELADPTPYELSQASLKDLQFIVETCQERDIQLEVFISPSHALNLTGLSVLGLWPKLEEWKREVVKITPVWDFATYNTITEEPIKDEMKYYIDSFHYNKKVGDLILNKLLGYEEQKVPDDFGILLTPDNIQEHLATVRQEREEWLAQNPKLEQLVSDLKEQKVDAETVQLPN